MKAERRGQWYLLTGLVIGLGLGLLFAWVISPVVYVDTAPLSLRADYKDRYRGLIASAYAASQDINRASARLVLLNDADPAAALGSQAQRLLADGGSQPEAHALAMLADAISQSTRQPGVTRSPAAAITATPAPVLTSSPLQPSHTAPPTQTLPASPILTSTPAETATANTTSATVTITLVETRPGYTATPTTTPPLAARLSMTPGTATATPTPTATQGLPYILKDRSQVCDASGTQVLLQVQVNDAADDPVPGVEIRVTWPDGEDRFFTGLKPELGLGYADFQMKPGVIYTLRLADGGQPISNLSAPECSGQDGKKYWGGWLLIFIQPK